MKSLQVFAALALALLSLASCQKKNEEPQPNQSVQPAQPGQPGPGGTTNPYPWIETGYRLSRISSGGNILISIAYDSLRRPSTIIVNPAHNSGHRFDYTYQGNKVLEKSWYPQSAFPPVTSTYVLGANGYADIKLTPNGTRVDTTTYTYTASAILDSLQYYVINHTGIRQSYWHKLHYAGNMGRSYVGNGRSEIGYSFDPQVTVPKGFQHVLQLTESHGMIIHFLLGEDFKGMRTNSNYGLGGYKYDGFVFNNNQQLDSCRRVRYQDVGPDQIDYLKFGWIP